MIRISKDAVFGILHDGETHRKQFSHNSGIQKNKSKPTFSVPFDQGLCQHFRDKTGKILNYNHSFRQHYCFLNSQVEIDMAEAWEEAQGTRVFIRNSLSSSMALDTNFIDNTSGLKTRLGANEEAAKHYQNSDSITYLSEESVATIRDISYLYAADYICAIPAMREKGFDLPTELAKSVSRITGKPDITPSFGIDNKTRSLKECSLEEKWEIWEQVRITYNGPEIRGSSVILIDDKYQSGITQQFFAMRLQEIGCNEVHGLSMVKTLRDTDNVQVVDG